MAQSINAPSSGDGFLSGHFGFLDLADDMFDNLLNEVIDAIDSSAMNEQRSLRASALERAEWQPLAPFLHVDVEYGEAAMTYDRVLDQLVTEVEYGGPETPPSPLLRTSVQDTATAIGNAATSAVVLGVPLG